MSPRIRSLTDADLLGQVIGQRKAIHLLNKVSHNLSHLVLDPLPGRYAESDISLKIEAATELVRRALVAALEYQDLTSLTSSERVRDYLRLTLGKMKYEIFMVLFLDSQCRLIASEEMFRGTLNQTSVYPREVVKRALELNAASVFFAHNHPSGITAPSVADLSITEHLRKALALIDAKVIDHFIVTGASIFSFAEQGLL